MSDVWEKLPILIGTSNKIEPKIEGKFCDEEKVKPLLTEKQFKTLQYIYIVALVVWLIIFLLVGFLNKYNNLLPLIPKLLLCIPFIVLFFNYVKLDQEDVETANNVDWVEIVPTAYMIIFLVFRDFNVKAPWCHYLNGVVGFVIVLTVLSSIDLWVPKHEIIYIRHVRSIIWTFSSCLLIFLGYLFYVTIQHDECV